MSHTHRSLLASALLVAAACSSSKVDNADMHVADLASVHTRNLVETSCPSSLSAMYSRCYVDYPPTDFF